MELEGEYTITTLPVALARNEALISKGFILAGQAFKEIRQGKLYRDDYPGKTFEQYCQIKWHMGRDPINRLIRASEVAIEQDLESHDSKLSVRSLADIASIPSFEGRKEVIKAITAKGAKPSVKEVKKAVDEKIISMEPEAKKRPQTSRSVLNYNQSLAGAKKRAAKDEAKSFEQTVKEFSDLWSKFVAKHPELTMEQLQALAIHVVDAKNRRVA